MKFLVWNGVGIQPLHGAECVLKADGGWVCNGKTENKDLLEGQ